MIAMLGIIQVKSRDNFIFLSFPPRQKWPVFEIKRI